VSNDKVLMVPAGPLTKLTVNLTAEARQALEASAERFAESRTDVVNRALMAYDQLTGALEMAADQDRAVKMSWRDDREALNGVSVVVHPKPRRERLERWLGTRAAVYTGVAVIIAAIAVLFVVLDHLGRVR
jgi:hypothetical protein